MYNYFRKLSVLGMREYFTDKTLALQNYNVYVEVTKFQIGQMLLLTEKKIRTKYNNLKLSLNTGTVRILLLFISIFYGI